MENQGLDVDVKLVSWSRLMLFDPPPPEFVVEGIIPRKGVTLITGEGGIEKSFMLMDLENHGHAITRRALKLAVGRAVSGFVGREPEVQIAKNTDPQWANLRLDTQPGIDHLKRAIDTVRPVLVTIDPLTVVHGSDENDNVMMRRITRALQVIAE